MTEAGEREIMGFRILPGFLARREQSAMAEAVRERPKLLERWTTSHPSPRVPPARAISSQMASFGDSEIATNQKPEVLSVNRDLPKALQARRLFSVYDQGRQSISKAETVRRSKARRLGLPPSI